MPSSDNPGSPGSGNSSGSEREAGDLLSFGEVLRPRGTRGELKVRLLCADAGHFQECMDAKEVLAWKGAGKKSASSKTSPPSSPPRSVRIEAVRFHAGYALVKLEGVDTTDEAERFRGHVIGLREDRLPPAGDGCFYHHELEGLTVVDAEGEALGKVLTVRESPGHDHLVVEPADGSGRSFLIPMVRTFVRNIDLEAGGIEVDLPPGLIESQR